jgi:hypothetical protein
MGVRWSPALLQGRGQRARRVSVVLPVGEEGAGHRGGRRGLPPICGRYLGADVRVFCAGALLVEEGPQAAGRETHLRADPASVDESDMQGGMVILEQSIHRVA